MNGLMLHCGANVVEREEVYGARAPMPTDTWHPIPHGALLGLATTSLEAAGLVIREEAHAMTPNQKRYFGLFQVEAPSLDYGFVIGFRNSVDKSMSAGMVFGTKVFVCDNLAFDGEIVIKRRHTSGIMADLPDLVNNSVARVHVYQEQVQKKIETYRTTEITDSTAEHAIVEMLRRNIVGTKRIERVVREWDAPRHPEFAEARNVYRLWNAATEANKGLQIANPGKDYALNILMNELVKEAA